MANKKRISHISFIRLDGPISFFGTAWLNKQICIKKRMYQKKMEDVGGCDTGCSGSHRHICLLNAAGEVNADTKCTTDMA